MNDDVRDPSTPSPELLAVSAGLDGVADPDERALLDASPQLRRQVDELAGQRSALADVGVPRGAREAAVAAALAVFDELHAPAAATLPTVVAPVVDMRSRRRFQYRILTAAAAAVAVLFVGGAVLGNLGGGQDDSASIATDAGATSFKEEPPADAATQLESATEMAPAADGTDAPAENDAGDDAAGSAESAPAPVPTIGSIEAAGQVSSVPSIETEGELGAFALSQSELPDDGGTGLACVPDTAAALGQVLYQGRSAVVGRDRSSGTVTAYDLSDCTALAAITP